jgi:hypothetical protein
MEGKSIAQQIESAAFEAVYLCYGFFCTFWDFLFRPELFRQLSGIIEGDTETGANSPYVLPMTYVVFSLLAFLLYLPEILALRAEGSGHLAGQALHERIALLQRVSSTVMGAKLPQIVLLLVPFFLVASLYAALTRLSMRLLGLETTFEAQLKIEAYAAGTDVVLLCLFLSPRLVREPMKRLSLEPGTVLADLVFYAVVALALAAFALSTYRYLALVHDCGRPELRRVWKTVAAVVASTATSLAILWVLLTFWFPFALSP